jgi:hypothetical protein
MSSIIKINEEEKYEYTKIGNQKPLIEEGITIQWPKDKGQRDIQWSTKHYTEN